MIRRFYHGSLHHDDCAMTLHKSGGRSDGAELAFASCSVNVAWRYGSVYEFIYDDEQLPRMSAQAWSDGEPMPHSSFIIQGDPDSYDYPADVLVLRIDLESSPIQGRRLAIDEIIARDDGLAYKNEPEFPEDRQADLFVEDICGGDLKSVPWGKNISSEPSIMDQFGNEP